MARKDPQTRAAYAAAYYATNREKLAAYKKARNAARPQDAAARRVTTAAWRKANPEADLAYRAAGREANAVKVLAYGARWAADNPAACAAKAARRRATELTATPAWADHDLMADIYTYAAIMREHGVDCHVDHEVPLQGKRVSGLHTHDNLSVISPSANTAKGNRFTPGG